MKAGTEYELFVKHIYEKILATEVPGCMVQHNVILTGRGGIEHQIDVYWEFTVGGIVYRTAVECKDYNSRVSKQKIAAFRTILDDIGGIHGIYATKVGYQSGAIEFAKQYGIELLEIRHPEDKDWKDCVQQVTIRFEIQSITNIRPIISIDSSRIDRENPPIRDGEEFPIESATAIRLAFDSINPDIKATTVQDLINGLPRGEEKKEKSFTYSFRNGYMDHGDAHWPIASIMFQYMTVTKSNELVVKADPALIVYINHVINGKDELKRLDGGSFYGII